MRRSSRTNVWKYGPPSADAKEKNPSNLAIADIVCFYCPFSVVD
jgi:hypothetical protein